MMGIGALVIFIAIILIAAIAAAVLITTGGSLQQKALVTGTQTEEGIASGIEAVTVVASDASPIDATPHKVGDFKIMVRLRAGSTNLNLNTTIVTVDTDYVSYNIIYNSTVDTDRESDSTSQYNVYYVQTGSGHEAGYLNRGDVIKLIFKVDPEIGENEYVRMKVIPRIGSYTLVEFQTPNSMGQHSVTLWPS